MRKRKITVLGGDQRSLALAKLLAEDGHRVVIYGLDTLEESPQLLKAQNLKEAVKGSEILLGPLPFTNKKGNLNTPLYAGDIEVQEVLQAMSATQIFIGGKIDKVWRDLAEDYGVQMGDYFAREEMQVLNAIPSAEGAIQVAMENMPITLHNSKVLILGFGRIGKVLAKMLQGIGAKVYVEARKYTDLAWIQAYGYVPVPLKNFQEYLPKMNVIMNTIPVTLLDEPCLEKIDKDCLIIDLASAPGGVDFRRAEEMGREVIWALALPGKVAPITAAQCIKETVYNIVEEWEE